MQDVEICQESCTVKACKKIVFERDCVQGKDAKDKDI